MTAPDPPSPPDERFLHQVALSIRKRHLLFLLRDLRKTLAELRSAKPARRRRARLLRLARRHGLAFCLEELRTGGMTLESGRGSPMIIFDGLAARRHRVYLREKLATSWRARRDLTALPLDDLIGSLRTLFQEATLAGESPVRVRFVVDHVVLEGTTIGDMEVLLWLEEFKVEVWNLTADTGERDGFQHPHVNSGGEICWNDYEAEARAYHTQGDFPALKDLIENLLRTYNAHSPYINLYDWENGRGDPCHECGGRWSEHELRYSESCEASLCPDCRQHCIQCGCFVPDRTYDSDLEACHDCVDSGRGTCELCQDSFWTHELESLEIKAPKRGKPKTVLACGECRIAHAKTQKRKVKKDEPNLSPDDDHADSARPLASPMDVPADPV